MSRAHAFAESRAHAFLQSRCHARGGKRVKLLAYYKLDEASLPAVDEVGAKNLTAGSANVPVVSAGQIGNGYFANAGVGQGWVIQNNDAQWDLSAEESFTVRGWFWYSGTPQALAVASIANTGIWELRFDPVAFDAQPHFEFIFKYAPTSTEHVYSGVVSAGWHRIVVVFRNRVSQSIKMDNDATNVSPTSSALLSGASYLQVVAPSSIFSLSGCGFDEIAIWTGALSEAQMLDDWNAGAGKTYPDVPGV